MRRKTRFIVSRAALGVLIGAIAAAFVPATASSFDAETYFKGKTIRFITGSRPGGGTDILLRYVAANFSNFFPGKPRFVVSNIPPHVHGLSHVPPAKPEA